ncbi:MAG: polyamine aminopropyltransferase [Candidatus Azotimanducaceae bacterium]|uniref:Polyamine aminopropyltransferase n=1 Tax=OM182 bacterium TaxID=2510334 RepID=A0A520RWP8_9GAMM|nr:spermidine synthase [Gammaproteobacteria bacterium]RZO74669.1 MAG: polyamine aminopropyltransferase [OM182 bacterium]
MRTTETSSRQLLVHDVLLISIMGVLAACGLIYEYLLSHYAGRVIGAIETAIYTMIGLMIVSMGLGALAAKLVKDPFTGFAWLEALIAICGVSCILIIATVVSFSAVLPKVIAEIFSLPPDLVPEGGLISLLHELAMLTPYFFGVLIGFLIGMEIPLIARVREHIYGQHLEHNVGTIYGADYIGAGVGAALWVSIMLSLEITEAAVLTAIANLVAGIIFLIYYWINIAGRGLLLGVHGMVLVLALAVYQFGSDWIMRMTDLLYEDPVVYSSSSRYQNLTITERYLGSGRVPVYGFYINGRLQFSSNDEHIYHSMLVYPAMSVADHQSNVLIIGGGDGLALRDVLDFAPKSVTLIDLDRELVEFFSPTLDMEYYRDALVQLNKESLADSRVEIVIGDAFTEVDNLRHQDTIFDAIIVDLPDPSHPDLDRLYSSYFYQRLHGLLSANGVLAVQSTSPYHAKKAFISIGRTISAAGFSHVEQYRQNIPSFGEWGWTVGSKQKISVRQRLQMMESLTPEHSWLTRDLAIAAFEFPKGFFQDEDVRINTLGTNQIYQYHSEAWKSELGLYLD